MQLIEPQVRPPAAPPSEDQVREVRALVEAHRIQYLDARPARLAAISAGPPLRDAEAAADCRCGCHPSPARMSHHDGGTTCPCQQTPIERAEAFRELMKASAQMRPGDDEWLESAFSEVEATAEALGVEAEVEGLGAPFAISGKCDGTPFYFRERHGAWSVEVALGPTTGENPWHDSGTTSIVIAEGAASEVSRDDGTFSMEAALRLTVEAVRLAALRNECLHEQPADARYRFCGRCGVELNESERWRWTVNGSAGSPPS